MYQQSYFVDKTTDTFADTLLAFGVAALLSQLLREQQGDATLRIRDNGSHFAIQLSTALLPGAESLPWFSLLDFIETRSKKPPAQWIGRTIDYEATRLRQARFFELRKQLPPAAKRIGASVDEFPVLAEIAAYQPPADWQVVQLINQMGAITAYAQVMESWMECRTCFSDVLRLLLQLYSQTPNDVSAASVCWRAMAKGNKLRAKESATPVQALNPAMGKGINRPKADGADRLGNPEGFWLLEYLKFVGLFRAGVPRVVKSSRSGGGKGPRDRKTYVLHPVNIQCHVHARVHEQFSAMLWDNTAIKMDVLAALRYTDIYLEQWIAGQADDPEWDEEPGNHVRGLTTAFYKDLGSAVALMNLSEIALPQWMRVRTREDAMRYRAVVEEHRRVISSLDEGKAEGHTLLLLYREFLSGHDLDALFKFAGAYSALLMSQLERGQWVPQYTTTNLEVLVTAHDRKLMPILEASGFLHIATAIRMSTVRPQYFKAKGDAGPYSIRYGLGTELLRHAAYPDRFIQALSEFAYAYNHENGRIIERYKGAPPVRRSNITTEDLSEVLELIDAYGSRTVAHLLVAFGYARDVKESIEAHDEIIDLPDESTEPD